MPDPETQLHTEEPNDQIMEDYSSKRVQQSFESAADPSKKPRFSFFQGISIEDPDALNTTLIKAVSYESVARVCYDISDEEEKINKAIKRMENNKYIRHTNGKSSGSYTNDDIDKVLMGGCDPGPMAISAGPVLEVISFSIHKESTDNEESNWEDFGIFGDIALTDYLKNTYYVYKCPQEDPEHVREGKDLFLTSCPIAPAMEPKVKFNLNDADSLVPLFKEGTDYYLNDSLDCGKEVIQDFHVEGDNVATMVFKKTPLATMVELEFFINYKSATSPKGTTFKVVGFIKVNNILCWKSLPEGVNLKSGCTWAVRQFRSVFAVPLGTLVEVDISLEIKDGMKYKKISKLRPKTWFTPTNRYYLTCDDEEVSISVDIDYASHHDFFHVMFGYLDMKENPDIRQRYPPLYPPLSGGNVALVEVFSILVCGANLSVAPLLWGQIVVRDQQGKVYVFARNKDRPDKCLSNEQQFKRSLSLAWPDDKWVLEKDFYMHLRLKDVYDNKVCKGYLSLHPQDVTLDRRLCNVILGENGYSVAVHYSVFFNGKRAKVSVKCSREGGDQYRLVYGSVFAEYDNYDDYHSTYDKECYRIIIFKRTEEECLKVNRGSEIPLSKSCVSAPSDCGSLSVHVNLCVVSCTGRSHEPAIDKLVFEAGRDQFRSCGKGLGCVAVGIEWFS